MYKFYTGRKFTFTKISWVVILFLVLSPATKAQQTAAYDIQANIIYHFTKYIDWPDNKKSGDFIIGVVGDSPLFDELNKNIAGKKVGDQKIRIQKYSVWAGNFNCHILFISDDESRSIKKIVAATAGTAILLVSETEGLAQKGACINFTTTADHLKLEINKNNIEQRELNIASELLELGKIVN